MEDEKSQSILNYRRLSEDVATAGQPLESQLEAVVRSGFEVVINLGLLGTDYSLSNEKEVVKLLGLEYVHIPVQWGQPKSKDLDAFMKAMEANKGKKLFVHCAANKRVSAFMALYRVLALGWPREQALVGIRDVWKPNDVWQNFIENELAHRHIDS